MKYRVFRIEESEYEPQEGLEPFAVTKDRNWRYNVIWCREVIKEAHEPEDK